jgi:hypothetical protein
METEISSMPVNVNSETPSTPRLGRQLSLLPLSQAFGHPARMSIDIMTLFLTGRFTVVLEWDCKISKI